ncbi:hypothetical protein L228DRAFT_7779 [Xylona heveae TC161]|uniref:Uncharacterized protein n=1 Tax=Xylona heveae (strain CBS 132557 / TC161) TaxID=1328760 RepID=A0A165JGM9_XYLHT|nr:hypothetical protein L228DRAFT_7779 [Xylona heveae TC161]KZF26212.1 hypothetical protein L228DRAFT_7779 [Xylona heveae TC161]
MPCHIHFFPSRHDRNGPLFSRLTFTRTFRFFPSCPFAPHKWDTLVSFFQLYHATSHLARTLRLGSTSGPQILSFFFFFFREYPATR